MKRVVSAVFAASVFGVSGVAFANHIDFFDDPTFTFTDDPGGGSSTLTQTGLLTGNTLGGQRDITLEVTSPSGSAVVALSDSNPGVVGDVDTLVFGFAGNQSVDMAQGSLLVRLGLGGDLNANFLDIPMSMFDWDRVRVDFGSGSLMATLVTVSLFSREDGGSATVTKPFGGGDANLDFLHSEFGVSPTFLRNVDQASLRVDSIVFGNYNLESFNRNGMVDPNQTPGEVSEPATLLLLTAAVAALGLRRRRQ